MLEMKLTSKVENKKHSRKPGGLIKNVRALPVKAISKLLLLEIMTFKNKKAINSS